VRRARGILRDAGHDPNLLLMVADTHEQPQAMALLQHPDTAIIDFTGGQRFGSWIEQNCRQAEVYTETSGCNSVVIESADDMQAVAAALAHSLCQASAQMCTSVQNIFVPEQGIDAGGRHLSFDAVAASIVQAVDALLADPRQADFLCGALVHDDIYQTLATVRELAANRGNFPMRAPRPR